MINKPQNLRKFNSFLSIVLSAFTFLNCSSDDVVVNSDDDPEIDSLEEVDDEVIDPALEYNYEVEGFIKIENGLGGLDADLDAGDRFARDHDAIGDVNGDGVIDYVIGARSDDDGEIDAGAVYILFMNSDGSVSSNQKISTLEGGFNETLLEGNFFGYGVAGIGDYDNDGIPDIAASATNSTNRALYIIHLNSDGTVKNFVKNSNIIAQGLSAIGDINNDGRIDLVACEPSSDLGGISRGAINILFLDDDSQVVHGSTVNIGSGTGGFGEGLEDNDQFGGREVAMLGDIDNDGTLEMAVGAFTSDGGKGAIWMLSLNSTTFNVESKLKITEGLNGFTETLDLEENPNGTFGAQFGHAMCAAGDIDGDGITDLVTGANQQNEGNGYILYLNEDKTVKTFDKISATEGGFDLFLGPDDRFARSISYVGDLKGDGSIAINFGGGVGLGGTGSLYTLFFRPN
ncbi:integrin alpha [Croceitalea vernalis]|uniref:FG-GAP-like repeat-containing protein n=1 Tax=Croceitalea vernalis TaxID=3075599 RepID=A0ABU3BHK0_9FLAO|nr:FG-GAP-like repeat-containing protein [Croceitalea sp. P007]MDT0621645.1 FG-GAP-like repeat-containing protein [Croceitalea sp. P007]